MSVLPEGERLDARKLPAAFREECSCCDGKGSHVPNCWFGSNDGQICNKCDGNGVAPTQEGWDLLRFLRAVIR